MMRTAVLKTIFLAAVLCGLTMPPARAEVRILASPGGQVGPFLDLFERCARFRRTRRDRRAVSVGLHAGVEHRAAKPHLRDAPGDPGIPRRAIGRPAGADVRRTGSVRTRAAGVSGRGAGLDKPPRRIEFAPATAARARTRGDLSEMPVKDQLSGGQLTIQGMPNWSTHMPNPLEKKVLPNGMLTLPPSLSALNFRSASEGSATVSETEKPCGLWK